MRILLAEDSPVFQALLKNMLTQWGYDVVLATNGEEAWEKMRQDDAPKLALLDWMMPGMDGVEVCRKIRAQQNERYVYIMLLTAKTERQALLEGMEAGADDYITKPFDAQELRVRLRAGTRILQLQEEILLVQQALREQATHDALTKLWNRAVVFQILRKELARCGRQQLPLAVVMIDLDDFKRINDTHGHQVGDVVLEECARRMSGRVRSYDSIGRYGGEEFVVVLPGCDGSGGAAQAERLRESIAAAPMQAEGLAIPVTCSLGVSWTTLPDTSQIDLLVRAADAALYQAKHQGRNRVEAVPLAQLQVPVPELAGLSPQACER